MSQLSSTALYKLCGFDALDPILSIHNPINFLTNNTYNILNVDLPTLKTLIEQHNIDIATSDNDIDFMKREFIKHIIQGKCFQTQGRRGNSRHCGYILLQFMGKNSYFWCLFHQILIQSTEGICRLVIDVSRECKITGSDAKGNNTIVLKSIQSRFDAFFEPPSILCKMDKYSSGEITEACLSHGIDVKVFKLESQQKQLIIHPFTKPCVLKMKESCVSNDERATISDHQIKILSELVRRGVRKNRLRRFLQTVGIPFDTNDNISKMRKQLQHLIAMQQKGKAAVIDRERKAVDRQGLIQDNQNESAEWPFVIDNELKERC